jgi:hypothetical protein
MMDDSTALTLALWLANLKVNSIHLNCNEGHACNYMTAAAWIESEMANEDDADEYRQCSEEELQAMRDTNTIWSLQIYPATPIGSVRWIAPTMLGVIAKARFDWPDVLKMYPSLST